MKNWNKFELLLENGHIKISLITEKEMSFKIDANKWSKKEILGHLIDSARYNLQTFTEIQFKEKPYQVIAYNQSKLVQTNFYQDIETGNLLTLWLGLNVQILKVIQVLPREVLNYPCLVSNRDLASFQFLIDDYFNHLRHHLNQVISG